MGLRLQSLQRMPGMYLKSYNGQFNAGSLINNFLDVAYLSGITSVPNKVIISVNDNIFTIQAVGCVIQKLDALERFDKVMHIFDSHQFEQIFSDVANPILVSLLSIPWFSQSCILYVNALDISFSQHFLNGKAVTNPVATERDHDMTFAFTIPNNAFFCPKLSFCELDKIISIWQSKLDNQSTTSSISRVPKPLKRWRELGDFNYMLELTLTQHHIMELPPKCSRYGNKRYS